jgi:hypothetical protein
VSPPEHFCRRLSAPKVIGEQVWEVGSLVKVRDDDVFAGVRVADLRVFKY